MSCLDNPLATFCVAGLTFLFASAVSMCCLSQHIEEKTLPALEELNNTLKEANAHPYEIHEVKSIFKPADSSLQEPARAPGF